MEIAMPPTQAQAQPQAQPQTLAKTGLSGPALFSDITVDHGCPARIGRFFLSAEHLARMAGIRLSFVPMTELLAANQANRESWLPLISIFDPTWSALDASNAFCIVGRNHRDEIVATQAGRLLDLPNTSFADVCSDLRLFYADTANAQPGETCSVSAPTAADIGGRVLFSGAAWYRPDTRGSGLSQTLPRISRVYGYTHWNTDVTVTLMGEANMARKINQRNGYRHAEWAVDLANGHYGTARMALLWNSRADTLDDLADFTERLSPEIEADIRDRRPDQSARAV
jgi:hypothetical protein